MNEEQIEEFMTITAQSHAVGKRMIEMCGDASSAVTMWFSDPELQRTIVRAVNDASSASASSRPSQGRQGRQDAQGVIHIDDSDDDMQDTGLDSDTEDVAGAARAAQEDEDAAMARRLQEEFYGGSGSGAQGGGGGLDDDGVRAPMARTTEVLVAPGEYDEDDHESILSQIRARREHDRFTAAARRRTGANNPFAQSVWSSGAPGSASTPAGVTTSRADRLAELFRPPFEIISDFSWDEARDEGKEEKKWILVNLQDSSDFHCQLLNRDVWKDAAIVALVKENFIFLQYDKQDLTAERYINFYFPNRTHENPSNYPHVSVVDPRTGEQVKVWSGNPFPSASDFHSQLVEFLDRYSLAANSKNPVTKAKRPERAVDVDRLTEEQQLELALQNSLAAATGAGSPPSNISDPDALTHSTGNLATDDKGKAKVEEQPAAAAQPESAFSRIPSDRPHTEPAADPKTATRIQVRHSNGRTIRRFGLDETVSRIYEWIKAECPVPGKEGTDFELKTSPSGVNLIDLLDQTIKEAGLANGTVMLEFDD